MVSLPGVMYCAAPAEAADADALAAEAEADEALADAEALLPDADALLEEPPDEQPTRAIAAIRAPIAATIANLKTFFITFPFLGSLSLHFHFWKHMQHYSASGHVSALDVGDFGRYD